MSRLLLIASLAIVLRANCQTPDAIDLSVPWVSRGPNTLRLTGGFSEQAGSFLQLTDSVENLLGWGETSHLSAEVGFRQRRVEFGIRKPAAPGRIEFGFDVYGESFRYNQVVESSILSFNRDIPEFSSLNENPGAPINYVRSGYGARLFAELPSATGKSRLRFVYDYDISAYRPITDGTAAWFDELNFRGPQAPGSLTGIQTGRLTASYQFNSVDNPLRPTHGAMFRAAGGLAGVGGNVNFFEPDIEATYFHRGFGRRHVVALHVRGRLIAGYDGKAAPPVDRYYMGGEDELRGFDSWSVGPIAFVPAAASVNVLNPDGTARTQEAIVDNVLTTLVVRQAIPVYRYTSIGGDTRVVANAEYRIPLVGPLTLVLFDDVGINRTTFVHQLRLNDEALNVEFPQVGGVSVNRTAIAPGLQNPRMSLGAELQLLLTKLKIPVRFYWAWNPLAVRTYAQAPVAFDPSTFPNLATLEEVMAQFGTALNYREPRSRFQLSIGHTF